MKIKTSDLTGPALDWAVEKAYEDDAVKPWYAWGGRKHSPSTDWSVGGPIIEREGIEVVPWPNEWRATQHDSRTLNSHTGPTPLIAAMRCFVASRLGDEVDVPDELL